MRNVRAVINHPLLAGPMSSPTRSTTGRALWMETCDYLFPPVYSLRDGDRKFPLPLMNDSMFALENR